MGTQPDFFAAQQQQQQQSTQQMPNFPSLIQPTIPLVPFAVPDANSPVSTNSVPSTSSEQPQPDPETENQAAQPQQQQQQEAAQPRFPNIIQDEQQENRDWLDILYSLSRLMILLCLVYFYSSPFRCLIVIIIGVAIYS